MTVHNRETKDFGKIRSCFISNQMVKIGRTCSKQPKYASVWKNVLKEQDAFQRAERATERELERDRLTAAQQDRDLERDRLEAEKEKQDRDLERDRLAAAQQEREIELGKAKLEREVELARLEQEVKFAPIQSIERQNDKDRDSKFASEVEIEKMKAEKRHMRVIPSYLILRKRRIRWIVTWLDLRRTQ